MTDTRTALAEMAAILDRVPPSDRVAFSSDERDVLDDIRKIVDAEQRYAAMTATPLRRKAFSDEIAAHERLTRAAFSTTGAKHARFIHRSEADAQTERVLLRGGIPKDSASVVVRTAKSGAPVSAHRSLADALTSGLQAHDNKRANFDIQDVCRDNCRDGTHGHGQG